MLLLIDEHRAELGPVDNELQSINTNLSSFNTLDGFADKEKQIMKIYQRN